MTFTGRRISFNAVETCLIDSLPELCDMGLDTLSVDGRHKTYDYASAVVKAYKEGLRAVSDGDWSGRGSGRALESELLQVLDGGGTHDLVLVREGFGESCDSVLV